MNDDQIRSELERRAASAESRPDWSKRALLAAVWREVDARPQPVVTPRWPSFAGAAAVVVALLILVVAVPRLTPQPPAASPAGLEVWSAQSFASALQSGVLTDQTVLVDGAIVPYDGPAARGPRCGPNGPACLIGQLEGVEPRRLVYGPDRAVADAAQSTGEQSNGWPWWHRVTPPVRGTLVLAVHDQDVRYVGLAHGNVTGWEWSVAEAVALDISTFASDDVAIVRGHLFNPYPRDTVRFCPAQTHPDLEGLPSRFCANQDYLSQEIWGATDLPHGAYLEVQAGAADSFGGDEEALYAISPRLYGGGCEGAPPCWFWDVVADLGTDRSSEPTPQPSPTPRQIACGAWGSLIDETGLVAECGSSSNEASQESPVTVQNQGGDQTVLEVVWSAGPCDGPDSLTFKETGPAYELVALKTTPANITCDGIVRETHVVLQLSQPIPAEAVSITNDRAPPTTPAPSPPETAAQIHICESADGSSIAFIDHSGLIVDCSMEFVPYELPRDWPVVSSYEPERLAVAWNVNTSCAADESMEFWGPIEGRPNLADYILRVARTTSDGASCGEPNGRRVVRLTLTESVSDSLVGAFLTIDGRGVYASRDLGAVLPQVMLAIVPSKPDYAEGEAVHVTTSLWPETDFTVNCLTSSGVSIEQLDGPISFYPGPFTLSCPGPRVLRSAEPETGAFVPVWGFPEPNPLAPWLRDGQLYLPKGTYLFSTQWSFAPPDTYEIGLRTELEAFVVVTVH